VEVFLSYARENSGAARALRQALAAMGHDVWADWTNIPDGAPWREFIREGIVSSDALVHLLTPDSAESAVCREELDIAASHNKRIVVLRAGEVQDGQVHPAAAATNWIPFVESDASIQRLKVVLDTDLDWVRQHTEFERGAVKWDEADRRDDLTLRGQALQGAVEWLARADVSEDRRPTELQRALVTASQEHEAAEVERWQTAYRNALARELAARAELIRSQPESSLVHAVLLAVESLRRFPTSESNLTLRRTLALMPTIDAILGFESQVAHVAFSADGKRLAARTDDGRVVLFDGQNQREIAQAQVGERDGRIAFSPDGQLLAVAGHIVDEQGIVCVLSAESGEELFRVERKGPVYDVAFSPDGGALAHGGWDRTLRLTNTATGAEMGCFRHEDGQVLRVAFAPDGGSVAIVGGHAAAVLNAASCSVVARIEHDNDVRILAVDPKGSRIATATWDPTLRLSSLASGEERMRIDFDRGVSDAMFSPGGDWIATTLHENVVCVSDAKSGAAVARIEHRDMICGAAFSADGTRIATASRDGLARVSDLKTGVELVRINHDSMATDVAFAPSGDRIATASTDKTVRISGLRDEGPERAIRDPGENGADHVEFIADGTLIAVVGRDRVARVYDSGGKLVRTSKSEQQLDAFLPSPFIVPGEQLVAFVGDEFVELTSLTEADRTERIALEAEPRRIVLSHDGNLLVGPARSRRSLRVTDRRRGSLWDTALEGDLRAIAFRPDDSILAFAAWDQRLRLVDARTGGGEQVWNQPGQVNGLAYLPDGSAIAVATEGRWVRLLDASSGEELWSYQPDSVPRAIGFSPGGEFLVVSEWRGKVSICDSHSGAELGRIVHDDAIHAFAFDYGGRLLGTASADQTARISELPSGHEIARIMHAGPVHDIRFAPDDSRVATASASGPVQIVAFRSDELIADARNRVVRNLTPDEWTRYVGDEEPYQPTFADLA
jgi:WD40 repeat protein